MAAASATEQAWEAVIGLETHVQLGTESKIFTAASTSFGDDPNTHIDPVVCGLPGTLPVLNQGARIRGEGRDGVEPQHC